MCGVEPIAYLIVPRFLACLLMVPVLTVYTTIVSLGSGTVMAYYHFGVNAAGVRALFWHPYASHALGVPKAVKKPWQVAVRRGGDRWTVELALPLAEFGVADERLNPRGGAIALGHPLGASGVRLATTLLGFLEDTGQRYGLQTMCEAGGMANALILENLGHGGK